MVCFFEGTASATPLASAPRGPGFLGRRGRWMLVNPPSVTHTCALDRARVSSNACPLWQGRPEGRAALFYSVAGGVHFVRWYAGLGDHAVQLAQVAETVLRGSRLENHISFYVVQAARGSDFARHAGGDGVEGAARLVRLPNVESGSTRAIQTYRRDALRHQAQSARGIHAHVCTDVSLADRPCGGLLNFALCGEINLGAAICRCAPLYAGR